MKRNLLGGVSAAVLVPRSPKGTIDWAEFSRELDFLLQRGISSFALNGATWEFCLQSPAEVRTMLAVAAEVLAGRGEFVVGIGASGHRGAIELGEIAAQAGAKAVLLPMPYFFPYQQEDLMAFCREVAANVDLPVLLYNLPQFTSGLDPATTLELVRSSEKIAGVKDSSGSLDTLRLLTASDIDCCRLIGNDNVLTEALAEGVCDGVVSGVSAVLPELILAIYRVGSAGNEREMRRLKTGLDAVIAQIHGLPVPWGLKAIAEIRQIASTVFCQPLSLRRRAQLEDLREWFEKNSAELLVTRASSERLAF
ncbi:MAG: dihydrodipicolinate synthase family protein [Terriglobia bacterium]